MMDGNTTLTETTTLDGAKWRKKRLNESGMSPYPYIRRHRMMDENTLAIPEETTILGEARWRKKRLNVSLTSPGPCTRRHRHRMIRVHDYR